MIVVLGAPSIQPDPDTGRGEPAGLAARIALGVAAAGASVQLAGTVGDDPAGDEVLLALARAGVRHDAVLRDPDRATPLAPTIVAAPHDAPVAAGALLAEEGVHPRSGNSRAAHRAKHEPVLDHNDVAMCLSYLREYGVVIVAEALDPTGRAAAAAAAAFTGAALVVIVPAGEAVVDPPPGLPAGATVLGGPVDDPDDDFARLVARYAMALERGDDPGTAFDLALAGAGWEEVGRA